jgi:hypothetical protein
VVIGVWPDGHWPTAGEDGKAIYANASVAFPSALAACQMNDEVVAQVDAVVVRGAWDAGAQVVAAPVWLVFGQIPG